MERSVQGEKKEKWLELKEGKMKKYIFVDADIFLTYFTGQDTNKVDSCRRLFENAVNGKVQLFSSVFVLAQVASVLEKKNNWKRSDIANNLKLILNTPNLRFRGKGMLYRVVEDYAKNNLDFIDIYHLEVMEEMGAEDICTYRREFDQLPGIRRFEP